MKKFLSIVFLMAFSVNAFAANATIPGWNQLTDKQKAEIQLQAANKAATTATGPIGAEDIEKWVNLGKSIGIGFASTAKELGMGIDELMKTDTGKIAMFLIVWNYIGDQFIGIVGGILWFMIMLPSWAYYFRRWVLVPTWEWHENGKRKSLTYERERTVEAVAYFTVALLVILGAGFVLVF